EEVCGEDWPGMRLAYDITPGGNWREPGADGEAGVTILHLVGGHQSLPPLLGISGDEVKAVLRRGRERMLAARARRVRPARDDKVITAWNGLMLGALAEAGAALGREDYLS